MRVRPEVLVGVALLACGSGWAQNKSLGDVAGSIKLNPEAIVETKGYVEDPRAAKKADSELLGGVLTDCSAAAQQLAELVEQARATTLTRGDELLTRLDEAARALERQAEDVYLLRLQGEFAESSSMAQEAADVCAAAGAIARQEIDAGGSVFSESKSSVKRCQGDLKRAQEQLAVVMNPQGFPGEGPTGATASQNEPEPLPSDDDIIAAVCGKEASKGYDAVEACRSRQYLSQAALASRSASNEMLDEGVFADIRSICDGLHPRDFVDRNNCELDRMVAARLESE